VEVEVVVKEEEEGVRDDLFEAGDDEVDAAAAVAAAVAAASVCFSTSSPHKPGRTKSTNWTLNSQSTTKPSTQQ
jgi:hypothetical protein